MNPRSGDGKVAKFRLKDKAEALGAEVALLTDPAWRMCRRWPGRQANMKIRLRVGLGDRPAQCTERRSVRRHTRADAGEARNLRSRPVIRMILTSDGLSEASRNGQPFCSA
jgi:hypothetical protein